MWRLRYPLQSHAPTSACDDACRYDAFEGSGTYPLSALAITRVDTELERYASSLFTPFETAIVVGCHCSSERLTTITILLENPSLSSHNIRPMAFRDFVLRFPDPPTQRRDGENDVAVLVAERKRTPMLIGDHPIDFDMTLDGVRVYVGQDA